MGKFGGLYPADPVLACRCDELLDVVDDIQSAINKVGADKPKEEKEAARIADATSGELAASMAKVEAYVGAHGSGGHAVGASLSVADLMISTTLSFVFSGFFDGVSEVRSPLINLPSSLHCNSRCCRTIVLSFLALASLTPLPALCPPF